MFKKKSKIYLLFSPFIIITTEILNNTWNEATFGKSFSYEIISIPFIVVFTSFYFQVFVTHIHLETWSMNKIIWKLILENHFKYSLSLTKKCWYKEHLLYWEVIRLVKLILYSSKALFAKHILSPVHKAITGNRTKSR